MRGDGIFPWNALRFPDPLPIFRAMHPDVAKLVEAGRIPKPLGERLSQLAPGNFCIHKSFGAGKVVDWDLPAKRVVIDFEKSAGQTMELQFAIQKTEWIANDDFRARKIEQLEELRTLSKSDPVNMVIHLLESHGGSMTGDALEKELCGTVIPEADFKKWWDATKKALRESRKAVVPQKRTEAIVLRSGDHSPAQAMVADFEAARDIKGMIKALEAIAADIGAFDEDTDALKRLARRHRRRREKGRARATRPGAATRGRARRGDRFLQNARTRPRGGAPLRSAAKRRSGENPRRGGSASLRTPTCGLRGVSRCLRW